MIEALLKAGAQLEVANPHGDTALIKAAREGHLNVVDVLLEAGAQLDVANKFGHTPLMYAAVEGHLNVVEACLRAGAQLEAPLSVPSRSFLGFL